MLDSTTIDLTIKQGCRERSSRSERPNRKLRRAGDRREAPCSKTREPLIFRYEGPESFVTRFFESLLDIFVTQNDDGARELG